MKKEETMELLNRIQVSYPFFKVTIPSSDNPSIEVLNQGLIDEWTRTFEDADYKEVMKRFDRHVKKSKYAPTPAEVYFRKEEPNDRIARIEKLKREAEEVPEELKQEFRDKVNALFEKKKR